MIMSRQRQITVLSVLLSACVFGACGDDPLQNASGAPQGSPENIAADDGLENHEPKITSIRFEPADATPGKLLRVIAVATDPDRDPVKLGHTWTVNGREIPFSGSKFEIPANLKKGDRIEVSVVASDGKSNSPPAVQTVEIENRRPSLDEIQILMQTNEDGTIRRWVADPMAHDADGDDISYRYSWIVNGKPISETGPELDPSTRKRGDEIQLIVWAIDGSAESAPLKSAPFTIANSPPDIDSSPPPLDPSGRFAYSVRASDVDGDRGLRYSLAEGPEGMTIDGSSGELRWQATMRHAGEHLVEIVVDDRHGGETRQSFYVEVATSPAKQRP